MGRESSFDIRNANQGISRRKLSNGNDGWEYFYSSPDKKDKKVKQSDLKRIIALGIPPAWNNVWIAEDPQSHIQVIGTDAKGKKQYRYNKTHIEQAEQEKFQRLFHFINDMPKLEKAIEKASKYDKFSKEKVISTMLKLVSELHMRVGKEIYAKKNKSYGVSSLKQSHAKVIDTKVYFNFKGKSNKRLRYSINDIQIAKHIKQLQALDGEKLFQYFDEDEKLKRITDMDLNKFIKKHMKNNYTIKDFRTYGANYYFVKALLSETKKRTPETEKKIKKNILNALKNTAFYLRHTRAISKKSYVMSFTIDMYMKNPDFFRNRKNKDIDETLLEILKLYQKNISNKNQDGGNSEDITIDTITEYKNRDEYIIYYISGCPFSENAIKLLKKNNQPYVAIQLTYLTKQQLLEKLIDNTNLFGFDCNHTTVPIIFYKGSFVGGYYELQQILN